MANPAPTSVHTEADRQRMQAQAAAAKTAAAQRSQAADESIEAKSAPKTGHSWVKKAAIGAGVTAAVIAPAKTLGAVETVANGIVSGGTVVGNGIASVGTPVVKGMATTLESLGNGAANLTPGVLEAINKANLKVGQGLLNGLEAGAKWSGNEWTKFGERTGITDVGEKAVDWVNDAANTAGNALEGAVNKGGNAVEGAINKVGDFFKDQNVQIALGVAGGILLILFALKAYDMYKQHQASKAEQAAAKPEANGIPVQEKPKEAAKAEPAAVVPTSSATTAASEVEKPNNAINEDAVARLPNGGEVTTAPKAEVGARLDAHPKPADNASNERLPPKWAKTPEVSPVLTTAEEDRFSESPRANRTNA